MPARSWTLNISVGKTEILKSTDGFQINEINEWSREEERCDGRKKGGKGFRLIGETEYYSRALLLREYYFW